MAHKPREGFWISVLAVGALCAFLVPILLATFATRDSQAADQAGRNHVSASVAGSGTGAAVGEKCGDRAWIVEALGGEHGEVWQSSGQSAAGMVIELFTSPAGTWTLIITRPDGVACLLATGKNWSGVPGKLGGKMPRFSDGPAAGASQGRELGRPAQTAA